MTAQPWQAHVDAEMLERYALNQLSETSSARIEEHLLVCAQCQQKLAETDDFIATLRATESRPQKVENAAVQPTSRRELQASLDRVWR